MKALINKNKQLLGLKIFAGIFAWHVCGMNFNATAQQFNPEPWIEDFSQLKQEMAAHYSNLEWAITNRKLDLKSLSETTISRLRAAQNETEAKKIFESFLNAFGDGHLFVQWARPETNLSAATVNKPAAAIPTFCEQIGFSKNNQSPKIDFTL
jgi:hypothetical protein